MKPIITTDPHGEQKVTPLEGDELEVRNRLFSITCRDKRQHIVMTGEELDSLANQWLKWRDEYKPFAVTYEYTDATGTKRKGQSVASGINKADAIRQFKKSNRSVRNVKAA